MLLKTNTKEISLAIADIIISVFCRTDEWGIVPGKDAERFLLNAKADIRLEAHRGLPLNLDLEKEIFDSGSNWSLFRRNSDWVFTFRSVVTGLEPYAAAVINNDFSKGDIYIRETDIQLTADGLELINPLEYPFDEVLMVHLLSQGRGALFHSCGINYKGRGLLFIGVSGAGKSTTANIWLKEKNITVLNDDRIIVRKQGSRFWMYGTPWHGDSQLCTPERVLLEKIFFIKHAPDNYMKPLNHIDAVARLITCCFPTFWNKKGMKFTLDFCLELTQNMFCCELGFIPDKSILDFVKSQI